MKQVQVKVQTDHLERMTRVRSPIYAVAELVWNGVDADATKVHVNIEFQQLLGIDSIRVQDNGNGIDYSEAESAFENLGGSLKLSSSLSKKKRRLHGKAGQGRFRAFSLGDHVEWRTRYKKNGKVYEYTIQGDRVRLGTFIIDDKSVAQGRQPGTEVTISGINKQPVSLLSDNARQELTEQFALYLRQYPDVKIIYRDEEINPTDIQKYLAEYEFEGLKLKSGKVMDAILTIIEWNTETERNLYLCDSFGFALDEVRPGIKAPGFNFTAYLKSDYFKELSDENALLPGLNADVAELVDIGKQRLRQHFRERAAELAAEIVEEWKQENVYPYQGEPGNVIEEAERQVFDVVALSINEYLPDFERADSRSKQFTLRLVKQAVEESPKEIQRILIDVLELPREKQSELAELLERTSLTAIINASKKVADRLNFLKGLEILVFRPDSREALLERKQLHKIIQEETWIFGEEFNLSVSDQSLPEVLRKHIQLLGRDAQEVDSPVLRDDETQGIVDLMLSRRIPQPRAEQREHLVVKLKRPSQPITPTVADQITSYAFAVVNDERFKDVDTRWNFWAVSNDISDQVRWRATSSGRPEGVLHEDGERRVFIWVKTWGQIINASRSRLEFFQQQLQYSADDDSALTYLRRIHEKYLPSVLTS